MADQIIDRLKNNPVIAYLVVIGIVLGGITGFLANISQLRELVNATFSSQKISNPAQHTGATEGTSTNLMPATPEELHRRLIQLAHEGCYFFRWDHSNILSVPPDVEEAQEGYYDQLMAHTHSDEYVLIKGYVEHAYSRIYATGLGTRRANSLKQYLVSKYQLEPQMISTMSYGEEFPAVQTEEYFCGARLAPMKSDLPQWMRPPKS